MKLLTRLGVIVLLAALTLSACESIGIALGLRTRLDKVPVTALSASLVPDPGLAPGKKAKLILVASTADGKTLTTVGAGKGPVLFDSFIFQPTIVQVKDGVVSMPADPRVSEGQTPHLQIAVVGHPEVTTDLEVPPRYDAAFKAHFSGATGTPGIDGLAGLDGSAGASGSIDLNNPSPGGNGDDGSRGGDGGNGGPGGNAQSVKVAMTLRAGAPQLIEVRVSAGARQQYYLIDPDGGSLSVDANGGAGGRAGNGGRGGRGGSGGSGFPGGLPGTDGPNGSDGFAGPPGLAGTISVTVDPAAQAYLGVLHLSNHNGNGSAGPAQQVQVQPVAALW